MATLFELVNLLDATLESGRFSDYCPNGLQVQGRGEINLLVTGVTASAALLDAAIAEGADAVLVHHGYFWKGEDPCITGMKKARLARLLQHDVSLLAYHLPLDAHPELGNNAQLAARLGLLLDGPLQPGSARPVGNVGQFEESLTPEQLVARVTRQLGRTPLHIPGTATRIRRVGICSGAAQGYIEQAVAQGVDAYISGEISEQTVHVARECGIHYFAVGHHASERYGVQALGEFAAGRLGLRHLFIDIDNPV